MKSLVWGEFQKSNLHISTSDISLLYQLAAVEQVSLKMFKNWTVLIYINMSHFVWNEFRKRY